MAVTINKLSLVSKEPGSIPDLFVHGAWGGVGPVGEIVVYLYQDTLAFPDKFELTIDPVTSQIKETSASPSDVLERVPVARLTMTATTAHNLAKWLEDKAVALERVQQDLANFK